MFKIGDKIVEHVWTDYLEAPITKDGKDTTGVRTRLAFVRRKFKKLT